MSKEIDVVLEGGGPWGIRLQGGVGSSNPLQIAQITPGSKASIKGLQDGSFIDEINGIDAKRLTILEAQELIKRTGNQLTFRVRVPSANGDGVFYDDLMNASYSGEGSWGSREAKGNTFNMMKEHLEAGQGNRVLSQFDVAQSQRNKALPTTAPKVHRPSDSNNNTNNIDNEVFSNERSDSNPARLVIMRGGKPWGMRLKGGKSSGSPLTIASVNPGSKAYNEGLLVNDHVISINDLSTDNMTVLDAQDIVKETGDVLKFYVTREAMARRLQSEADEDFFNDLKRSMSEGGRDGRGRDVKGNAFKKLQHMVDSQ